MITLEKVALRFARRVDAAMLGLHPLAPWNDDGEIINHLVHEVAHQFTVELNGYLLGEYPEPVLVTHPRDWWEALRARWAPAWWIRRHPIIETTHKIDFFVLYPDFKPKLPRDRSRKVVQFNLMQFDGPGIRSIGCERPEFRQSYGPYFSDHSAQLDRDDVINDGPWREAKPGPERPAPPTTLDEFRDRVTEDQDRFTQETGEIATWLHIGYLQERLLDKIRLETWHRRARCEDELMGLKIAREPVESFFEVRK